LKSRDIVHARVRRTAAQLRFQTFKCFLRSLRNYFNRSVRKVLRKPAEFQALGFAHDKPPEPYSLNATPDNPAPAAQIGD